MSAIRNSTHCPCDLPQTWAIAVSAEGAETLPISKSCLEKPDSRCTSGSLRLGIHALASDCLLLPRLTFSAESTLHDRASNNRRRAPPPMSPISQMSGPVLIRFSDQFVRGLGPPESIQNRMACRSPTVARPSPHDIVANLPNNFSPHVQFPHPDCGDCPRDWGAE